MTMTFWHQGEMDQGQLEKLMGTVQELLIIVADEILEVDAHLLGLDQRKLGKMCRTKQKAWTVEVEASRQS